MISAKFSVACVLITALLLFSFSVQAQHHINEEAENNVRLVPAATMPPLRKSVFWILENRPSTKLGFVSPRDRPEILDTFLLDLYMKNDIAPYWVTEYGPSRNAYILFSILHKASEEGLNPERYRVSTLKNLLNSRETNDLAELDIMLTLALSAYITDMREGRIIDCMLDSKNFAAALHKEIDIQNVIRQAVTAPDLSFFLKVQAPQYQEYQSLKKLLAAYRKLAAKGGWPEIPQGKMLRRGMEDSRLDVLAERLFITGDLQDFPLIPPPYFIAAKIGRRLPVQLTFSAATAFATNSFAPFLFPPSWRPSVALPRPRISYTGKLVKAVKHFQFRHNLRQDGIVGRNTLAALNIPIRNRINTIILNMERWRWLPHKLDGRRILVNIAGFQLTGINDQKIEITMPIIVGKSDHKTPVFNQVMTYIEVNPYWNIPSSIARNEIVGKMKKNPNYLRKQRIRIFAGWQKNAIEIAPESINWARIGSGINQYRLRQEPGSGNALGTIKFMFPNSNNVYMHDTPSRSLFSRTERSFSHGCIRLSRPVDLAWYILNNDHQRISKKQLRKKIARKKRKIFVLKQPLPVHIIYRTVRIDQNDGTVHFYNDVYGRDALMRQALFTKKSGKGCGYSY